MQKRAEPLRFFDGEAPLRDTDLDAFEQRFAVRLPAQYRAFLLARNGGRVEPRYVRFRWPRSIKYFFSLGGRFDVANEWEVFKNPREPRMPAEQIPIAECSGGDLFTIATSGPHLGKVFHWDHEEAEGAYENMTLVAPSFEKFLECIGDPDYDV